MVRVRTSGGKRGVVRILRNKGFIRADIHVARKHADSGNAG